jgi:hypothetical protein
VFPNVLDFWGPSGMIFVRDPQIRWTPWDANGLKAVVGLEVPSAAIDEGKAADFATCTPTLPFPCFAPPLDVLEKPRYPDITGHVRAEGPWGHVQLAGVARWVTLHPDRHQRQSLWHCLWLWREPHGLNQDFWRRLHQRPDRIRQGDRDLQQRLLL